MKKIKQLKAAWIIMAGIAVLTVSLTGCSKSEKPAPSAPAGVEAPKSNAAPAAAEHPATAPAAAGNPAKAKPKDHPAH